MPYLKTHQKAPEKTTFLFVRKKENRKNSRNGKERPGNPGGKALRPDNPTCSTLPILLRGKPGIPFEKFPEKGRIGKIQIIRYLLDRTVGRFQL